MKKNRLFFSAFSTTVAVTLLLAACTSLPGTFPNQAGPMDTSQAGPGPLKILLKPGSPGAHTAKRLDAIPSESSSMGDFKTLEFQNKDGAPTAPRLTDPSGNLIYDSGFGVYAWEFTAYFPENKTTTWTTELSRAPDNPCGSSFFPYSDSITIPDDNDPTTSRDEVTWLLAPNLPTAKNGHYIMRLTDDGGHVYQYDLYISGGQPNACPTPAPTPVPTPTPCQGNPKQCASPTPEPTPEPSGTPICGGDGGGFTTAAQKGICQVASNGNLSGAEQAGLDFKSVDKPLPMTDSSGKTKNNCLMKGQPPGSPSQYKLVSVFDFQRNDSKYNDASGKPTNNVTMVFVQAGAEVDNFVDDVGSRLEKDFLNNRIHVQGALANNPSSTKEIAILDSTNKYSFMDTNDKEYMKRVFSDSMTDIYPHLAKHNQHGTLGTLTQAVQLPQAASRLQQSRTTPGLYYPFPSSQVIVVSANVNQLNQRPGQAVNLKVTLGNPKNTSQSNVINIQLQPGNERPNNWSAVTCVN